TLPLHGRSSDPFFDDRLVLGALLHDRLGSLLATAPSKHQSRPPSCVNPLLPEAASNSCPPVDPYPSAPRCDSGNSSTSKNTACSTFCTTNWAIRSPRRSVTGSTGS